MTGDVGAGGGGEGGDGVSTNWLMPGISERRRPSDLEPVEVADVDPDVAAVARDGLSAAMLEVDAPDGLPE
jgi:hypothetical protein